LKYSTNGTPSWQFWWDVYRAGKHRNWRPNNWQNGVFERAYHTNADLSSVTALDNQPTVYFRLVDNSTTSAGANNRRHGSDRVDNFLVSRAAVTPIQIRWRCRMDPGRSDECQTGCSKDFISTTKHNVFAAWW